jgi:GH35 family endo-1,4-beta-xylanase
MIRFAFGWVMLLAVTLSGVGQELLTNPSFDTPAGPGLAPGWHNASWGLKSQPGFAILPEGGGQQLTLAEVPGAQAWLGMAQTLRALPPGNYRLTARLKADRAIPVDLQLRLAPSPYTAYGRTRQELPAGVWTEVVAYAQLPALQDDVFFMILQHAPGTVLVQRVSAQKLDDRRLTANERQALETRFGPPLAAVDESSLLAETDVRILKNRTAPLTIQVLDDAGRPVPRAEVRVEHTRHNFHFGAGFDPQIIEKPNETEVDRRHREAFLKLFNYATVHLYWSTYEPQPGGYGHEKAQRSIRWLQEHRLTPRGHPVFWNHRAGVPRWLEERNLSEAEVIGQMDARLGQLSATVLKDLHDADIFNELVHWERFSNSLTRVVAAQGKTNLVARYLRAVRQLNPDLLCVVNDYDNSPDYYALLKTLIATGAPVDILGQQSHMHGGTWSLTQIWTVLERLGSLQRPVLFSELSVLSGPRRDIDWQTERRLEKWGTDPENERKQADYLEQFFRISFSHPACQGIVLWDYADRHAWLGAPVGLLRADGSRKPSFEKLDRLINEQWRTRGTFTSDAQGRVVIPAAFEGDYEIRRGDRVARGNHRVSAPWQAVVR